MPQDVVWIIRLGIRTGVTTNDVFDAQGGRETKVTSKTSCPTVSRYFLIPDLQQYNCPQETVLIQGCALPHIHRGVQQFLRQSSTEECVISHCFPTTFSTLS
ncbi:hypothetical protein NPIL_120821 [Nephila pilipes]|uniref:Uncharacterized protein n=1 Tax=Nephila pilipes TaxID=299642 RepID=A0A8X6UGN8_NEPPI|nr:hypothetical protein NPIL_120821 [Nephila pilipes]